MPNPDPRYTLRNLPAAFRKAERFFCWGRAIRALLTLFCEFSLLLVLCRAADPFCAAWNDILKRLLVWAALLGMFLHAAWIFLAPWIGKRGLPDFFTMLSHGSEKARKIAAPLLTRRMLADDTAAVIRVLTRSMEHFLPPAALCRAAASEGLRAAGLAVCVLLLLLVPFGRNGGLEGKLLTLRSWLMGAGWTSSMPLEIRSLFPGETIIKPGAEWVVKVVFNREPEGESPAVRCIIGGKRQNIPLVAVSAREYQALMAPFSGECRYAVEAENRSTKEFTILAQPSAPVVIRQISLHAATGTAGLPPERKKWTVPAGARVTLAADAPANCVRLEISGSGGLRRQLRKDPETGFWKTSFTVWESGAFFFQTLETDGTRGGSELYTLEIRQDNPPSVRIAAPANLAPLHHPGSFTVEAEDDFALKSITLHLNNLKGGTESPGTAALSGTERERKEPFRLTVTKSARLITSVIAVAAEAEENSPVRRNAFSEIHFHPVVVESESEMLNNPQVIRAFREWRKNRKYEEPNKKIPPPESPDKQKEPERKQNTEKNHSESPEEKQKSDGSRQEKSDSGKQDATQKKHPDEKQNTEKGQEKGKKQNDRKGADSGEKQNTGNGQEKGEKGSGKKQNDQKGTDPRNEQGKGEKSSAGKQNAKQESAQTGGEQDGNSGKEASRQEQAPSGGQENGDSPGTPGETPPGAGTGSTPSAQQGEGAGGQATEGKQGAGNEQENSDSPGTPGGTSPGAGTGSAPAGEQGEGPGGQDSEGKQGSPDGKRDDGGGQEAGTHRGPDGKQKQAGNGQAQAGRTQAQAASGSSQGGEPSAPGGGGNTALNTGRNAENPEEKETSSPPEVVVGTARRGDGKKSDPQQDKTPPQNRFPQNTEKDKPYSAEDDNLLHAAEPSGGKRETLLLKESGIELVPGRKYTPEQKSELERAIRRYDAVRARLNDGERRTADEYYRRLREILKQ